ncbi:MFS transporter [Roseospira visakhapatnamensis]|uniref:MFS family permease n=1 Tax=Roseospira visakhapatnamensis TaxID=390880 RepID=A0A7W6W9L1_9PROT|nr:MFS transporter [Roseospira visakhapatnamensis]MBB4265969.1 MFS family permease [Roseospira visakhapatnamensis]
MTREAPTQQAPARGAPAGDRWATARLMLVAGSLILAISLGVRHSFGLFLTPMSLDSGWGRETFAFAMAVQNLVWGVAQPVAGLLSDRHGAGRVILGGGVLYAAGLAVMALPQEATLFTLSAGVLIGLGLSGCSFPIIFGAISRAVPADRRSLAMGISMSVGSFGQFAMLPLVLPLIGGIGWSSTLLVLATLAALILPLSLALAEGRDAAARPVGAPEPTGPTARQAIGEALGSRDFWLLSLGFFVCGFQVVFIAVHLPAYLQDQGLPPTVATTVLALIGLLNIAGTYLAGVWGGRHRKPMLLVGIYLARAAAIAAFVMLPATPWSAYAFGVTMGLFWLSTVPLTNEIVAAVFGVRNMAMLGGVVFLAHQIGSFLGGWLGGIAHDRTGSYDAVWWIAIALSVAAAALNAPIRETPLARRQAAGAAA